MTSSLVSVLADDDAAGEVASVGDESADGFDRKLDGGPISIRKESSTSPLAFLSGGTFDEGLDSDGFGFATTFGVGVGVAVAFGVGFGVGLGVAVGVGVGVGVGFGVGVDVGFGVGVGVAVGVGVGFGVGVGVAVGSGVGVAVGFGVGRGVGVEDGVGVEVGEDEADGEGKGVGDEGSSVAGISAGISLRTGSLGVAETRGGSTFFSVGGLGAGVCSGSGVGVAFAVAGSFSLTFSFSTMRFSGAVNSGGTRRDGVAPLAQGLVRVPSVKKACAVRPLVWTFTAPSSFPRTMFPL